MRKFRSFIIMISDIFGTTQNSFKIKDRSRQAQGPLGEQNVFIGLLCVLGLAAIWLAKYYPLPQSLNFPLSLLGLIMLLALLIAVRRPSIARLILLITVPVLIFLSSSNFKNSLLVYDDLYNQKVAFFGTVQDDAAYNQYSDYEFNLHELNFAGDGEFIPGKIRIRTKQPITVYRGDRLFVEGKLKSTLGSRMGSIGYANVEVVRSSPGLLERSRLRFFAGVQSSMPEPHSSLGVGFLAGVRSSIQKDFNDDLSRVGLTHIIAVSGYNLTILVLAISKVGKRFSKFQRLIFSLVLIGSFLLITGFAPSIVRAAVVSTLALVSVYFGRRVTALNLILISAFVTAGVNPTYLWSDIGWWLSFMAFSGVLILAPAISGLVYKGKTPGLVGGIVLESFSAQVVVAPLIAHVFGTFSVISLLANVLVLPWIPLIMLLVFMVGLSSFISPSLALVVGLLPKIIMTPIIWLIEKLASLPWASAQLKFGVEGMVVIYLLLFIFVQITNIKLKKRLNTR